MANSIGLVKAIEQGAAAVGRQNLQRERTVSGKNSLAQKVAANTGHANIDKSRVAGGHNIATADRRLRQP